MSIEVKAAPEETNLQGWLKNVTKHNFIDKCVFSSPVTADEMNNEDKLICCKQKGFETNWISKSECTYQQQRTYRLWYHLKYSRKRGRGSK